MAEATRVALLARPGGACDRLRAALQEAGAEVVLVADPTTTDAGIVRGVGAQAVLVALEPMVEDVLDRFDDILGDPAMTVIFDEAELAAQREGWDAARWVRHLSAKLGRRDDVLPPGTEPTESVVDVRPTERPSLHERSDTTLELTDFAAEAEALALANTIEVAATPAAAGEVSAHAFDPVSFEFDSTALEAPESAGGLVLALEGLELSLATPETAADESATSDRFQRDLDELHSRIADMELVDAPRQRSASPGGAIVVLAGIGGPDAVRQLLGGLPAGFPRPVLIQQRLDGARHDKLVRQMQRATSMPVHLAEPGMALESGNVYVLPGDLGITTGSGDLRFAAAGTVLEGLPPGDSAVVLLSGSDPAVVDIALGHAARGTLVAGQTPEGCYDAAAPEMLIARGGEPGTPAELAKKLATRWPA